MALISCAGPSDYNRPGPRPAVNIDLGSYYPSMNVMRNNCTAVQLSRLYSLWNFGVTSNTAYRGRSTFQLRLTLLSSKCALHLDVSVNHNGLIRNTVITRTWLSISCIMDVHNLTPT